MKLSLDRRYLVLPVSEHAQIKKLCFEAESGKLLYDLDVRLDPIGAQHCYYADLGRFSGELLNLRLTPEMDFAPELTDSLPSVGDEVFRPIAHFTTKRGWINDPNGLVYYEGKYHLFFQHNPVGMHWGNMHWGHAVSDDLIHWDEKETALFPDEFGTMYSGCAVIDERNVSGLRQGDHAPLLLFYTAAGRNSALSAGKEFTQCLAYSVDGGETFMKYEDNPLIDHIIGGNRDPKVIFCPEMDAYVMALYLDASTYALFKSENLLNWEMIQKIDIPSDAECPDFFPLYLEGEKYWILSGASDYYLVGKMTAGQFVPVQEVLRLKSRENPGYAAQTYFGLPDNRRVRFYWNRFTLPGMAFNGSMSTPVELFLAHESEKVVLGCRPVSEFDRLHGRVVSGAGRVVLPGAANDIHLTIPGNCRKANVCLFGLNIDVDVTAGTVRVGKDEMTARSADGSVCLRIIQDIHSTEIFSESGIGYLCVGHLADLSLNYIDAPECVSIKAAELINYRK